MFKVHTNMAASAERDWRDSGVRQQNSCVLVSDRITRRCLWMLPACGCNGCSHIGEASILNKIYLNPHVIECITTFLPDFKDLSVAIYF